MAGLSVSLPIRLNKLLWKSVGKSVKKNLEQNCQHLPNLRSKVNCFVFIRIYGRSTTNVVTLASFISAIYTINLAIEYKL